MPDKPPFFYPSNKYIDDKWALIHEFIIRISEGNYGIEVPEPPGDDHLDSVLVALKMMAETLNDREQLLRALTAIDCMKKPAIAVDLQGKITEFNSNVETLLGSDLQKGKPLEDFVGNDALLSRLRNLESGMSIAETYEAKLPNGEKCHVEATFIVPADSESHAGALLFLG